MNICETGEHAFTSTGACIYCPACRDFQGVYVPENGFSLFGRAEEGEES